MNRRDVPAANVSKILKTYMPPWNGENKLKFLLQIILKCCLTMILYNNVWIMSILILTSVLCHKTKYSRTKQMLQNCILTFEDWEMMPVFVQLFGILTNLLIVTVSRCKSLFTFLSSSLNWIFIHVHKWTVQIKFLLWL